MDFYRIKTRPGKKKGIEVYPDFVVGRIKDLMVRGKSFYAVWDAEKGLWSTDEYDVARIVDKDIRSKVDELRKTMDGVDVIPKYMANFSSGSWTQFQQYVSKVSDNYHELDEKLTFANTETKKKDYISRRLPYPLADGDYSAWDEIVGTLYSEEERKKIEWSIGSVVSGDSRDIQKFLVFYGEAGSGKSTILNVIQKLFDGYFVMFDAKALTSNNNAFATEVFRSNPLVAIQHDGDLSKIEDNTKLNSIVSHELMTMNEKYKSSYTARANCFLFMASNKPVKITDAKSGVIRRLIDVKPTNKKIPAKRYFALMNQIDFELGAIAKHCLDVYRELGKNYYGAYRPVEMMYKTDLFFNFVEDSYVIFKNQDSTSLKAAYAMYKAYCDDSGAEYKLPMYKFREELKNYFRSFEEVGRDDSGKQVRSWYTGFMAERFRNPEPPEPEAHGKPSGETPSWLVLDKTESLLDEALADCKAQYAKADGSPEGSWSRCRTTLKDIDTGKTHYVLAPQAGASALVTVDFDLKNDKGEKDAALNIEAAGSFTPTYAEFSNGGAGVHLEYWYDGDWTKLNPVYAPGIEVKVQSPNSTIGGFPLRRRVSLCNDLPITHIASGLPLKEEKVIDFQGVKSEKQLRNGIAACMRKEHHGATKPEVDFILKMLDDAYASGIQYDVTDMRPAVTAFAQGSTHQADACLRQCLKMKWKSEEKLELHVDNDGQVYARNEDPHGSPQLYIPIVFFDVEVFPNLFLICYKFAGKDKPVMALVNPTPQDIEDLMRMRLVGFNCRRYDNHMLYACYIGYSVEELYELSQRIISDSKNAMFREAYGISYTDIYDFCSKKQSLKKWEIELGIHHQELGLPWDQPVPQEKWQMVTDYCKNDVIATEAVFDARQEDWIARQILSDLSGLTVNDTTNSHSTRFIFGTNRTPQNQFNYRDMGDASTVDPEVTKKRIRDFGLEGRVDPEYTLFTKDGKPVFPGYLFDHGKSTYRGEEVGEGGYVYAVQGIWHHIPTQDVAGMHPSSAIAEELFGPEYTKRFADVVKARVAIKHGDYEAAKQMLDGKLAPYLEDKGQAKKLAGALKIVVNSVYGLTAAKFENPFRDPRNIDNIVAKRGALFMVNLKNEVQSKGFTVVHIKTDSIKVAEATPEIISFIRAYGAMYGYTFETEHEYEKLCLVNDAVYIAKYEKPEIDRDTGREIWWDATGAQFQQPYVFKTLFSHEPITFDDMCETKSVTQGALYLNFGTEEEPLYRFVGRAGQFTPIKPGHGGGQLVREKDGKYYAATGTKGYSWMESESIRGSGVEDDIDRSYYDEMVEEAVRDISQYGDFEEFAK